MDPSGVADALLSDELILVVLIALVALAILPTFIFLIEVVIVAVLMLMTVLARVLFRQPWLVDAVADDGSIKAWKLNGYRASRRAVSDIADQLTRGTEAPLARGATLVR